MRSIVGVFTCTVCAKPDETQCCCCVYGSHVCCAAAVQMHLIAGVRLRGHLLNCDLEVCLTAAWVKQMVADKLQLSFLPILKPTLW
jgi:hypothetical protein